MKKQINITVFDEEECDGDWPPMDAKDFIAWFVEKVETIPEEYRATAKVEIEGISSYGAEYAHIEIHYNRPETDDEEERRERQEEGIRKNHARKELEQLAKLKAKYETSA